MWNGKVQVGSPFESLKMSKTTEPWQPLTKKKEEKKNIPNYRGFRTFWTLLLRPFCVSLLGSKDSHSCLRRCGLNFGPSGRLCMGLSALSSYALRAISSQVPGQQATMPAPRGSLAEENLEQIVIKVCSVPGL